MRGGRGGTDLTNLHRLNPLTRIASQSDLSPVGRGENKIPFSRRAPRPRFAYHHNKKALFDSLPSPRMIMRNKEGSGRREAHPTNVRATLPDVTVRQCAGRGSGLYRSPLAFRRSTCGTSPIARLISGPRFLELPGANGRTLPGASAASTLRTGRRAGRYDARSRLGAGLRSPPAGTAYRSALGTSPVTPSMRAMIPLFTDKGPSCQSTEGRFPRRDNHV